MKYDFTQLNTTKLSFIIEMISYTKQILMFVRTRQDSVMIIHLQA